MNNNRDFEQEYDSLKDVVEFQNNLYNPGHYIGTGKVPPVVSAPGNATPLAVFCFFISAVFLSLGLLLFFSDVNVHSAGWIQSPLVNKLLTLAIMVAISSFSLVLGFAYLKKAKKYHREKAEMDNEQPEDTAEDELWQRTCPQCGQSHDFDYPKCPNCRYDYLERYGRGR